VITVNTIKNMPCQSVFWAINACGDEVLPNCSNTNLSLRFTVILTQLWMCHSHIGCFRLSSSMDQQGRLSRLFGCSCIVWSVLLKTSQPSWPATTSRLSRIRNDSLVGNRGQSAGKR